MALKAPLTFYPSADLVEELTEEARRSSISRSELIIRLLREGLQLPREARR